MIEPLPPLELFGVYERGVPNRERIVLRVNAPVQLREYGIVLGWDAPGNTLYPATDNFLWLGPTFIDVASWVFVYTGSGQQTMTQEINSKDPAHVVYWNRSDVILKNPEIKPALFRMVDAQIFRASKHIQDLKERELQSLLADNWRQLSAPPKGV